MMGVTAMMAAVTMAMATRVFNSSNNEDFRLDKGNCEIPGEDDVL